MFFKGTIFGFDSTEHQVEPPNLPSQCVSLSWHGRGWVCCKGSWWTTKNGGFCLVQYYRYTSPEGKMVTFLQQQLCENCQKNVVSAPNPNLDSRKVVQAAQKLVHTVGARDSPARHWSQQLARPKDGCAPSVQLLHPIRALPDLVLGMLKRKGKPIPLIVATCQEPLLCVPEDPSRWSFWSQKTLYVSLQIQRPLFLFRANWTLFSCKLYR